MKTAMKISTTKGYIASVNFHGASSTKAEWEFSRTPDGSDLDLYSGAAVVCGNKGDRSSQEWFIVAGDELLPVEDSRQAEDVFFHAAEVRCAVNQKVAQPLGAGAAEADAMVATEIKGYLS